MRVYLCDPSRGKRYRKLKRIRTWTVKYRRDRNRTKTAQIEWLCNEKNLLFSATVLRKGIAQFNQSIRQLKEVKLWQWACTYTADKMFNFYPTCNIMCTEVSSSMIFTRETKLVLIHFKQVHFSLQSWVFRCMTNFLCYKLLLYISIQLLPAFIYLGGERHCEINTTCPRTQRNAAPDQGSNPNRSIRHVATRLPSMLQ